MASGLSRFGRPAALACNLGTSGTLANHTPGSAYAGTFSVTNRVGNVTAELVSSTPALPAGWSLAVNQATGVVTLAWPAGTPAGALPNLGFEAGDDGSWRRGNRWVIDSSPLVETGTQSAKYDGGGQSSMTHSQAVPVTPGTTITATARFSKGTTREDFAGGGISLFWLDANGNFISASRGNVVNTGSAAFQNSTVTGTAPAGAALVTMELSATRDLKGRARDKVYVDNVSWNHSYAIGGGQTTDYAVVIRVRDGRGCQATLSQTVLAPAGPGAHRYWRIFITANNGSPSFVGLTEALLLDAAGVNRTLLTGLGPALASSELNADNRAFDAFNNSLASGWLSNGGALPQWVRFDFGNVNAPLPRLPVELKQITVFPSWNALSASPRDFALQWSDDDINWTTALTVTNQTGWVIGTGRTFNVF